MGQVLALLVMVLVAVPLAAGLRSALAGPRHLPQAPAQAFSPISVYLPLGLRRFGIEDLPPAVTALPSATPTETPLASATPLPTETPSPTPTRSCGGLADRVRVSPIDVSPDRVLLQSGRGWSTNRPVMLAGLADGGAKVAWTDAQGRIHITPLDAEDRRGGADLLPGRSEVRGFVAHSDGGTALLVGEGDTMTLRRMDAAGKTLFEKKLVGGLPQNVNGNKWIDDWGHEGRLVWSGTQYGAYFGHTQAFGPTEKHQGDLFWIFDDQLNKLRGGWDWGCSHSLDLRLAHNGERFGPVCLSDAFPTKGFHFNHRTVEIRSEPSGNGAGRSDARLGGLAAVPGGFWMTFTSPEGRPGGQSDVGLVPIGSDGEVGPVRWLTDTRDVQESSPHLAVYGDGLLAGWAYGEDFVIARLDAEGRMVEGPVRIEARIAERDDFVALPNGDVAWASAWGAMDALQVVRVAWCEGEPEGWGDRTGRRD